MRVQKIVFLVAIVCLLPLTAAAEITRISPSSLQLGNVEEFLTVFGSGLAGTELTRVVFDGPAGEFSIEPGNYLPSTDPEAIPQFPDNVLQVWVPVAVAITPGTYDIYVVAKNVGEATRTLGPLQFVVLEPPLDGPPIVTAPESIIQEASSSDGATVFYDVSAHSQDGTPLDVLCSRPSGTNFSIGTTSVSCSATDSFATTTASFYVVVGDFTSPVVTVPDDFVTESREVSFNVSAVDNLDGVLMVTCTPASGALFPLGLTRVYCTATDLNFNTGEAAFFVRVLGGGEPVLTVPADITVTSPDDAPVFVDYTVTATNNAEIDCLPSGNMFAVGTTIVTCTATNLTGTDTKSFKINVLSGAAPEITVPADITAEATSAAGAVVTFVATATNNATISCAPASGSTFALGTTAVTCTATNPGGSDTGTFNVTVRDTTPPVLALPLEVTAEATSAAGADVTYAVSATDLVDGSVAVQCTPVSGSTFALGTTTVNCSSSDTRGNTATDSFDVLVQDTTPPQVISVTATPGVLWPPNHQMVDVTVSVIAVDLVDPDPVSHILSVISNQPVDGTGDGDTAPDWIITGPLTVKLRSERAQGKDRTYKILIETIDDAGNSVTSTVPVYVSQTRRRAVR
jgi:hypothetical protein